MRGISRNLRKAMENAERSIAGHDGSKYGRGLSSEGYAGGYLDALRDVDAALRGIVPSNSRYWPLPGRKE